MANKIEITPAISLYEKELQFDFVRASGPGGQNVNKVATAVQLRFDVANSASLPDDVRQRLSKIAGRRISESGVLIIEARRYRSQARNRVDAVARLVELIRKAAEKPKPRRKTKPPASVNEGRLKTKKRRGETKRLRRSVPPPSKDL